MATEPAALPDFDTLLATLVRRSRLHLERHGHDHPYVIGIQSGGAWLARRLAAELGLDDALGTLDISFHRDDFDSSGLNPLVQPSQLPWDVGGRDVLLVDDVLYTGRTVRAAINEIFDWGRPASISLAVLVSRDGRELPVQADACGLELVVPAGHEIKLRGPEPLRLEWRRVGKPA